MNEGRRTLAARREHSKGDGNFPDVEPTSTTAERPEDRAPADLPKERDPRSAPKGNVTTGQTDRNPELDMRDDHRPRPPEPNSGFEEAQGDAILATSKAPKPVARPNARRSASAKREAVTTRPKRARVESAVPIAPKDSAKSGRRAAVARRAQPGKRRTGTARRGGAVSKAARGSITARKAKKAERAKPRRTNR